jgi:hypothetical protein
MLTITQRQMEMLAGDFRSALVGEILARTLSAGEGARLRLDEARLRPMIEAAVSEAVSVCLLTSRAEVALFVELSLMIGPAFYRYPPIWSALRNADMPAEGRLRAALDALTEWQWAGLLHRRQHVAK